MVSLFYSLRMKTRAPDPAHWLPAPHGFRIPNRISVTTNAPAKEPRPRKRLYFQHGKAFMEIVIRPETPKDIEAIAKVTAAAFDGKPYADGTEQLIIQRLREAGALSLSLVAELEGRVIGHVAFSIVTINGKDKGWYGLGPISVTPELQKQGIGSKLIREGLSLIQEKGAKGCVLEGSPAYYHRFGFKTYPQLFYAGAPAPEYFMALPFYDEVPAGKAEFHKAFYN